MSSGRVSYEPHSYSKAFQFNEESENPFEPDSSHNEEISDNPFESGDISDEKATWDPANLDTHVIDSARDQDDDPNVMSYSHDCNQRPRSATSSFYSLANGQLDSQRASRRSYTEEYSEFHAGMANEPNEHDNYDDDDDWGDSTPKKRLHSAFYTSFSIRGVLNMGAVTLLALGLVVIFGVLPITTYRSSHRQAAQLVVSSGGIDTGNASDTRQNTMTRRRFDGAGLHTITSEAFARHGTLRSGFSPPLNAAHHWDTWETLDVKKWEKEPHSPAEKTKVTSDNAKQTQRRMVDLEL
ncbi:hypothetical protein PTTG_09298 [Puccinia triticina 1-1 BBBD Race 1]|uniref:Uncharacterized protein n=2 Tax=Puccinia triticina TaxID=208348 RepID=A0A0C4F811_PUCT1|nr:uncharacterized protein PtA15_7A821 [Puccinia triticina]OAV91809.1 hypothetical protein PTTG_09298 [Puccinia triticina 1-1 BBBD Race 1]WAQ87090.1 hypothetical protein PtA15_7A821 [Puccinia triticina]WAR56947.1 hypothetical protein PtB15_7B800 [Puccinia triticina]